MRRRQLLRLGAIGLAGLAVSPASRAITRLFKPSPAALYDIRTFFRDPEAAREIGRRFLIRYPNKADRALLRALTLERAVSRFPAPGNDLDSSLNALVRDDFSTGRTVLVEGWVLSESEAGLCALLALG